MFKLTGFHCLQVEMRPLAKLSHLPKHQMLHVAGKRFFASLPSRNERSIKRKFERSNGHHSDFLFFVAACVGAVVAMFFQKSENEKAQLFLTSQSIKDKPASSLESQLKVNTLHSLSSNLQGIYSDKDLFSLGGYEAVMDSLSV